MRVLLFTFSFFLGAGLFAQQKVPVIKIEALLKRISNPDTLYVVNFWATWCKPCVQELPSFDTLTSLVARTNIKVLLVSLDFAEDRKSKVIPFTKKKNVQSECVLLDEVNGNDFINRVSPEWSGAIPATLLRRGEKKSLIEKKLNLKQLNAEIEKFRNQ